MLLEHAYGILLYRIDLIFSLIGIASSFLFGYSKALCPNGTTVGQILPALQKDSTP